MPCACSLVRRPSYCVQKKSGTPTREKTKQACAIVFRIFHARSPACEGRSAHQEKHASRVPDFFERSGAAHAPENKHVVYVVEFPECSATRSQNFNA
eukprot:5156167-Alexandrium_andersonii.AAC.1